MNIVVHNKIRTKCMNCTDTGCKSGLKSLSLQEKARRIGRDGAHCRKICVRMENILIYKTVGANCIYSYVDVFMKIASVDSHR